MQDCTFVDIDLQQTTDSIGNTIFTLSGATLTFTTAPCNGAKIFVQAGSNAQLLLDGTDSSSTNAGHQILTEDGLEHYKQFDHVKGLVFKTDGGRKYIKVKYFTTTLQTNYEITSKSDF